VISFGEMDDDIDDRRSIRDQFSKNKWALFCSKNGSYISRHEYGPKG